MPETRTLAHAEPPPRDSPGSIAAPDIDALAHAHTERPSQEDRRA